MGNSIFSFSFAHITEVRHICCWSSYFSLVKSHHMTPWKNCLLYMCRKNWILIGWCTPDKLFVSWGPLLTNCLFCFAFGHSGDIHIMHPSGQTICLSLQKVMIMAVYFLANCILINSWIPLWCHNDYQLIRVLLTNDIIWDFPFVYFGLIWEIP